MMAAHLKWCRAPEGEFKVHTSRCSVYLFAFLSVTALTTSLVADDWTQFRGADGRGVAELTAHPERWSETENVVWKQPIPGRGWSSPIIAGNRVFITTVTRVAGAQEDAKPGLYFGGDRKQADQVDHSWELICFDLKSGDQLWNRTLHQGKPRTPRHIKNSYASETPATDGELVFALFGDLGLFCCTIDGELVWSKELPPCKTRFDWGTAASPILHKDRLYFVSDSENASYLAALDKRTGDDIWKVERDEKSNWATPFVWANDVRTEIITHGTGKTRAYDLKGKLLYQFGGASSITIARPYAAHGLLYVSSGYILDPNKPIFAIRPGASGEISLADNETSNASIAWCQKQAAPYNPSTIVYGDQLYVLLDRGLFAAYDAKTGKMIYDRKRLGSQAFTASPWACDGKIYCLDEFGETNVVKAGPEFEILHTNKLNSEQLCMSSPAIADGKLILRTGDALYCIGQQ